MYRGLPTDTQHSHRAPTAPPIRSSIEARPRLRPPRIASPASWRVGRLSRSPPRPGGTATAQRAASCDRVALGVIRPARAGGWGRESDFARYDTFPRLSFLQPPSASCDRVALGVIRPRASRWLGARVGLRTL